MILVLYETDSSQYELLGEFDSEEAANEYMINQVVFTSKIITKFRVVTDIPFRFGYDRLDVLKKIKESGDED